jgi:hypothetical protein
MVPPTPPSTERPTLIPWAQHIAQIVATGNPLLSVPSRLRRLVDAIQRDLDQLPTPPYSARIPVRIWLTTDELAALLPKRYAALYAVERTGQHGKVLLGQPGFHSRHRLTFLTKTLWALMARYCGAKPVWKILRTIPHGTRRTIWPLPRHPDLVVWVPPTFPVQPPFQYLTVLPRRAFRPRPSLRTPIARRVGGTPKPSTPSGPP